MSPLSLSIVLPVFNEADSIVQTIRGIQQAGLPHDSEIIVVDDGSMDGSAELAASAGATVIRQKNGGYGAALMTGFKAAQGSYIAFLDADATYPPSTLKSLWEHPAKESSMVVADRFSSINHMPLLRKFGNRVFSMLAGFRLGRPIPDLCSGQRLFPASWVKDFENLPSGLHFSPALTMRVHRLGKNLEYLKTAYEERAGNSKLGIMSDGFRFLWQIIIG